MILQALTTRFFKGIGLFQCLLLVITVVSFTSCAEDEREQFYFDAVAQKEKDEKAIRQYFRDNNVDTTAVERSETGLYYLEVTEGTGEQVQLKDTVTVHYIGRFTNNLKFDSSYDRGRPATFIVRPTTLTEEGVIDGWVEGLQKMRIGGEGFLYIPSHLAYGPYSRNVPPNSVLVFNVEVKSKN